jgi:hypothetical protein
VLLSDTETRVQRVRSHLRDQRERLLQDARSWRASATMLRANAVLMGFPEIAAQKDCPGVRLRSSCGSSREIFPARNWPAY